MTADSVRSTTAAAADPAEAPYLRCLGCDQTYAIGMLVHCPTCGPSAFLRTGYDIAGDGVPLTGPADEFASYSEWLPFEFCRPLPPLKMACVSAPQIAEELGLSNVWLAMSGHAPAYGATLPTCTFKTLEAVGVMSRVLSNSDRTLIISSAGNAGVGVLEFGARWNEPAVVVIPESAAELMMTTVAPGDRSPLLICLANATYLDAIKMVNAMVEIFGDRVVREGGAFNVARRDSMSVPLLRAAAAMGQIPDHYFQAVGSGTGGIASYEASLRLAEAGVEGGPMHLHLVQNAPFTPMAEAWMDGADAVEQLPREEVLDRVSQTYTSMLANAKPPYGVVGGVRDVLRASDGAMYAVTNEEAEAGAARVSAGFDFVPAPEGGAAMAGLVQAAERGVIGKDDAVLVHLTGGGYDSSVAELGRQPYPVAATPDAQDQQTVASLIRGYLGRLDA